MNRSLLILVVTAMLVAGCALPPKNPEETMKGSVSHLNPPGLHKNPAFSQVVVARGQTRTVYIGGQNSVDSSGTIVGSGDIGAQAAQVALNLQVALASVDARAEHVVKWTIYVVQGQPVGPAMAAFQQVLGPLPNPPTISVLFVAALAHPEFLIEVDAVAIVPEE